jgi:hypothetical protein
VLSGSSIEDVVLRAEADEVPSLSWLSHTKLWWVSSGDAVIASSMVLESKERSERV